MPPIPSSLLDLLSGDAGGVDEMNSIIDSLTGLGDSQSTASALNSYGKTANHQPSFDNHKREPVSRFKKPCLIPVGETTFHDYLGIELELEANSNFLDFRNELVYKSHKILNAVDKDYCILKRDGSLKVGFEICTRPATLDYHRDKLTNYFHNLPFGLIATKRCGLHVHLARAHMSALQIGKIIYFINKKENADFISLVSGRPVGSVKHCEFKNHFTHKYALKGLEGDFIHWSAVNILNKATVELRIFQASLDLADVLKSLEFAHALNRFTFPGVTSIADASSPKAFVAFVAENRLFYPNLANFLVKSGVSKIILEVKNKDKIRKVR